MKTWRFGAHTSPFITMKANMVALKFKYGRDGEVRVRRFRTDSHVSCLSHAASYECAAILALAVKSEFLLAMRPLSEFLKDLFLGSLLFLLLINYISNLNADTNVVVILLESL